MVYQREAGGLAVAAGDEGQHFVPSRWRADDVEALSADTIALRSLGLM